MMKTSRTWTGLCLAWMVAMLLPSAGRAATGLTIEPFGIAAGETKEMVVDLQNATDPLTLVQFDLRLPDGLAVATDNDNQLMIDMAGRTTWRSHSLNANHRDGIIRFLLASTSNALITGTEGALVKVTLTATADYKGGRIALEKILLVTPAQTEIKPKDYVLSVGTAAVTAQLSVEQPAFVEPGGTRAITIDLNNSDNDITLVQFDLRLPDGVSIKHDDSGKPVADMATRATGQGHTLSANVRDGVTRFLLANSNNAVLTGKQGAIMKIWLVADNDFEGGAATLENILLVTPQQAEGKPANVTADISNLLPDLTVTAKSYSITYGDALPQFSFTTTGTDLGGEPVLACTATADSPAGTYPITVSQGTVSNYTVQGVAGTLTIKKATLIVKVGNYTKKQGETNPTFTLTYSGFKKGETEAVITTKPTATCNAVVGSSPGNYTITVKGGSAQNYSFSYQNGTLTVTQADPVTITAGSYSITYGEALPQLSYTTSGAELKGTPTVTCSATSASPVGEYDIVVSKGSVSNYNVTYVKGKLTITKAPLTIKAGNYIRQQGSLNPEFTAIYEGFKNGETDAMLTTKPTLTCEANISSAPGEYIVTVGGAVAQNYSISYVNGLLTVYSPDNAIYIEPISGRIGGDVNIEIKLKNAEAATAYVFDLVLPEGITVAKNENGKYIDALSDRHDDHSRTFNDKGNNTYSLSVLSGNSEVLTGNDGAIRLLTLHIDEALAEGTYAIDIKNASYSKSDGSLVEMADTKSTITVENYLLGDVNGNDKVDIGDAVSIVNFLVGKPSTTFLEKAADTNKNGKTDIGDAVTIVNFLVGKTTSLSRIIDNVWDEREPQ